MAQPAPSDTTEYQRIYFDTSAWNRLREHREGEAIVRWFHRSKRAVFVSVVNAAELLRTRDPRLKRELCDVVVALHRTEHALLGHPGEVLAAATAGMRRGESRLTLGDVGATATLRWLVEDPARMTAENKAQIDAWVLRMHEETATFRRELREILGSGGFVADANDLIVRPEFAKLMYEKISEVRDAAASAEEVFALVQVASVWAAYAGGIAYEFEIQKRSLTRRERKQLPEGPDIRQLVYLGVVNRFVSRDAGLLAAARWVVRNLNLRLATGSSPIEVLDADSYFARIGYPFAG